MGSGGGIRTRTPLWAGDFKSRETSPPSPNKHSTLGNRGKSDTEIIRRFRDEQHFQGTESPSKSGPEGAEK